MTTAKSEEEASIDLTILLRRTHGDCEKLNLSVSLQVSAPPSSQATLREQGLQLLPSQSQLGALLRGFIEERSKGSIEIKGGDHIQLRVEPGRTGP